MADVRAVVSFSASNAVAVLDLTAKTFLAGPLGATPSPSVIAVLPNATEAYIVNGGNIPGVVFTMALPAYTLGSPITVDNQPFSCVATPDGTMVYTQDNISGSPTITPIATPSNVAGSPVLLYGSFVQLTDSIIACNPAGTMLYISSAGVGIIPVAIPSNVPGTPFGAAQLSGGNPGNIIVMPSGNTGYVGAGFSGSLWPINFVTQTVGSPYTLSGVFATAGNAFLQPGGSQIFICNSFTNLVSVWNTTTNTQIDIPLSAPAVPSSGAFSPDGKIFYCIQEASGVINYIDTTTLAVVDTFSSLVNINNLAIVPVPTPPPSPSPLITIGTLFIPRKGFSSGSSTGGYGYAPADLMANWLAIEHWANTEWSPAQAVLFIPCKRADRMPTVPELDANWLAIQRWVDDIGTIKGHFPTDPDTVLTETIPPIFIPRKSSLQAADLDTNFLAIQNYANRL